MKLRRKFEGGVLLVLSSKGTSNQHYDEYGIVEQRCWSRQGAPERDSALDPTLRTHSFVCNHERTSDWTLSVSKRHQLEVCILYSPANTDTTGLRKTKSFACESLRGLVAREYVALGCRKTYARMLCMCRQKCCRWLQSPIDVQTTPKRYIGQL